MMPSRGKRIFFLSPLLGAFLFLGPVSLEALPLTAEVTSKGNPLSEAIVYAKPLEKEGQEASSTAVIDQIDKEYVRGVTAIQKGTGIKFPNHDKIRHHVYSFSPAKTFEIPLYLGTPREPVVFDKEGVVSLGCNIHDWMSAYVFVVDTPYFAGTDKEGKAKLDLPPGKYQLFAWHSRLRGPVKRTLQEIVVKEGESPKVDFQLKLKKVWKPRRGPVMSRGGGGGYR